MKRSSNKPLIKTNSTKCDIDLVNNKSISKKIQRKSASRISSQSNVRKKKFRSSKAVTSPSSLSSSSCITNNNNNQLTNGSINQEETFGCDVSETAILRNLISTITIHPTLLVHSDFEGLRNHLKFLGVVFSSDTTDITIPIGPAGDAIGTSKGSNGEKPFLLSFGVVRGMHVDLARQVVTISSFDLTESVKRILNKTLNLLYHQPEIVYKPPYTFLYEFFIHFGVNPTVFSKFVQQRRES